ncbi:hypothetical protein N2152v2_006354 [Parachlorella kessleri]
MSRIAASQGAAAGGYGGSNPAAQPAGPGGQQQQQPQHPTFAEVMNNIFTALVAASQEQAGGHPGAHLCVQGLTFQPPGAPQPLLTGIQLEVAPNTLGLIFGRSGAGKTTLLQAVAGLAEQSSGTISFSGALPGAATPPAAAAAAAAAASPSGAAGSAARGGGRGSWLLGWFRRLVGWGGEAAQPLLGLTADQRMAAAGLVFQFPERHFIGRTLGEELTVGWPTGPQAMAERQALASRAYEVLAVVGLSGLSIDTPLANLSDGYKRRVALAVQLVRRPALLLLDEPLAGLDWRTRGELISLLAALKRECTMLVVSHDLRELAPLADSAWCMQPGGRLQGCDLKDLPVEP